MKSKIALLVTFLAITVAGVVSSLPKPAPVVKHHYHGVETLILTADPEALITAPFWEREVARRFPNALMVISHGGSIIDTWVMQTPGEPARVVDVVNGLRERYPGRDIVLVVCNPGHHVINIEGVHYAMDNVWKYPDKSIPLDQVGRSDTGEEDGIGNIYEFR